MVHPDGDRAVVPVALAAMLAAGLVLLVACANLAGVMLARGLARRREMAIRIAIGATPGRLVRQMLTESAILSIAGGAAGLLLAWWCARLLTAWRPELPVPVSLNSSIDWRVTAFTGVMTAAATVMFALLPAIRAARVSPGSQITELGCRRRWLGARDALLVPQLALALTLVVVAGLFARSLSRADAVHPGFDLHRTAFVSLNLAMSGYSDERAKQFYDQLSDALSRRGAVSHAALTDRLPLDLYGNQTATIWVGDRFEIERSVQAAHVAPGYLEAIGTPIVRGRGFDPADLGDAAPVAIVSSAAARLLWPGTDALGQYLRVTPSTPPVLVVGMAVDAKVRTLGEAPEPLIYLPLRAGHARLLRLVVRTSLDPRVVAEAMRREVQALDPAVAVFEARSMADNIGVMLYPYRLAAGAGAVLAVLALTLSGIGLYGVLACGVTERIRELAIRIAMGASQRAIVRAAFADAMRATTLGVAMGGLLVLAAGRLLRVVLFGISPSDPMTLLAAAALLAAVVFASSAGPVRRALRLAPMSVLRQ